MGGCRCSYRKCSLRSDGKTHMFHYPVFDKVRCHQWLTNAQKLEFLNLKVSQLKNRVVCQHHFKDENFMNFKKDKLTFDAVPTEDGPYCDSSQLQETKTEQDDTKVFSISLDDIENEYLTIVDKKANFSVKYGDFLTNCDLMELDSLNSPNQINDTNKITIKDLCELDSIPNVVKSMVPSKKPIKSDTRKSSRRKCFGNSSKSILNDNNNRENTMIQDIPVLQLNNTADNNKYSEPQQTEDVANSMNIMLNVSLVPIEFDEKKSTNYENIDQSNDAKVLEAAKPIIIDNPDRSLVKENKKQKIRIISEKKISEPVPLIGKLKPVSPNRILTFPNMRKVFNTNPIVKIPELPTNSFCGNQSNSFCGNQSNSFCGNQSNEMNLSKDNIAFPSEIKLYNSNPIIEYPEVKSISKTKTMEMDTSKDNLVFPDNIKLFNSNPVIDIPEVPINSIIENQTNDMNVPKQNLVLEKSAMIPNISKKHVSPLKIINNEINKIPNKILPNASLIKNKIPPERVAAIAEKRKFNMKLRDIIEDCLDKLDESDKSDNDKIKLSHKNIQAKQQQVGSYLAKEPELPSVQDYTIAYLEARMKKMENNLLNKIEENSQKIVQLKQTYAPSCVKKTVHTQTSVGEDLHKRQLYQELSKYLSQEANSLIYEELFINKYTKDVPKLSSAKRRKRRR